MINEIINATMHVSARLGIAMYIQRTATDKQGQSKGLTQENVRYKVKNNMYLYIERNYTP